MEEKIFNKVNDFILKVNGFEKERELRKFCVTGLNEFFNYSRSIFDLAKIEHGETIFYDPVSYNIEQEFLDSYYSRFQFIDTIAWFFEQTEKQIYKSSYYISEHTRKASTYYKEWLKPQNLFYSIGSRVGTEKKLFGSLNIWRSKRSGDFSEKDVKIFNVLNEHIVNKMKELLKIEAKNVLEVLKLKTFFESYKLTKREIEIAEELYFANTIKGISEKYFLSIDTVKKHSNHIYKKLDVKGKTELIKKVSKSLI